MPYIGDGDLAVQFYRDRHIFGADHDLARVETARARLPNAIVQVGNCEEWPLPKVTDPFSLADFDAYGNPYKSFLAFWSSANLAFPLVCFFTDGLRLRIKRGSAVWDFERHQSVNATLTQARQQYNFWLKKHVIPWIQGIISPYQVTHAKFGLRQHMVYLGCVIDNSVPNPEKQG